MNLFVGNLPYDASDDELAQAFSAFGQVSKAQVIMDRMTGKSRGFAFIEMPNAEEANAAITGLSGKDFRGRALTVNEAKPREEGGGGGGRGGRGGGGRGGYGGGRGGRGGGVGGGGGTGYAER